MAPKKATRREVIVGLFHNGNRYTCAEITEIIIKREGLNRDGNVAHYLSGSISTVLSKLVSAGVLQYAPGATGPRGGHIYEKCQK